MTTQPKVLLLDNFPNYAKESWKRLLEVAEVIKPFAENREEFLRLCRAGKADGAIVLLRTFGSAEKLGLIDDEFLSALPKTIKFISHAGAGYDSIDIEACTKHGILVSNVHNATDNATADIALFLIIGALRNLNEGMNTLRAGKWMGDPMMKVGSEIHGKTLGIIGMGKIGRSVRDRVLPLGMKVIYTNRKRLPEELEGQANFVTFDEVLAQSDVLSFNLPLNASTRHLISDAEFGRMKKGVFIVNTARGAIIDEAALVRALESGQVKSCGLDVFEQEPEIHPGLIGNPNVILLPHLGTWTYETMELMEHECIRNAISAIKTGKLVTIVPDQENLVQQ